jgi:hypothetical protein
VNRARTSFAVEPFPPCTRARLFPTNSSLSRRRSPCTSRFRVPWGAQATAPAGDEVEFPLFFSRSCNEALSCSLGQLQPPAESEC